MNFESSIIYQFSQLAVAYRSDFQKFLNRLGLHSGQIFVLISLWKTDGQSQIELVKNLNLAAPTIYNMVKSLAANGLVTSEPCSRDARMMRVFLTEKGRQSKGLVEEHWQQYEAEFFSNLTETEKLMLTHLFDKLRQNLTARIASKSSGS